MNNEFFIMKEFVNFEEDLAQYIKLNEGFRGEWYKDTLGVSTIGYGFTQYVVKPSIKTLTEEEASKILGDIISKMINYNNFNYPKSINLVLYDMIYNLGQKQFLTFYQFNSLISQKRYEEAADDLKTTLYCKQVKRRCALNVANIKLASDTHYICLPKGG